MPLNKESTFINSVASHDLLVLDIHDLVDQQVRGAVMQIVFDFVKAMLECSFGLHGCLRLGVLRY